MTRKTLVAFSLVFIVCFARAAYADTIVTIDVNASFAYPQTYGPHQNYVHFPDGVPAPNLNITGQFAFDADRNTIQKWNMVFVSPLGVTVQLNDQNVGPSFSAFGGIDCAVPGGWSGCPPGGGFWGFFFGNDAANVSISAPVGSNVPFYAGESLPVCPIDKTAYGNTLVPVQYNCDSTSAGSIGNFPEAVAYELPNGQASGFLIVTSVVSTPEPAEATMLLLGITLIFGIHSFSRL